MYINISNDSLRYGAYLGYKLSRLEWIWESSFPELQIKFESSKVDILALLPLKDIHINELDYKSFSQSILGYFFGLIFLYIFVNFNCICNTKVCINWSIERFKI